MAENELEPPVLGVSWDGTGYGLDGTVWGGEFFLVTEKTCERVAHLRQFRLPGGDKAVKEPRRTALGLLFEIFGEETFAKKELAPLRQFAPAELDNLKTMLRQNLNSPLTSSVGRLFDAVAALIGLRQKVRFEGQAAMELEFALEGIDTKDEYKFVVAQASVPASSASIPARSFDGRQGCRPNPQTGMSALPGLLTLDWSPMIEEILGDIKCGVPAGKISAKFHNALTEAIVVVAKHVGQDRVVLSGGCFQNRYLTERTVGRLHEEGFRVYWHQRIPPNDGGISLGQIVAALREKG